MAFRKILFLLRHRFANTRVSWLRRCAGRWWSSCGMRSVIDRRLVKCLGIVACGLALVAQVDAANDDPQIVSVLRNWETTSAQRDREGMAVRSLQPILGPIREACLLERFTWSFRSSTELEAVPADPAERQFSPSLRVTFNADGQPRRVAMGQRQRDVRDLVKAEVRQVAARESMARESGIVLASFNTGDAATAPPMASRRVQEVLTRWLTASKSVTALRTRFHRIDYDSAIEVEAHSDGMFVYCEPHQGLYHSRPSAKSPTNSARIGLDGRRYVQLPGDESSLFWKGKELVQIDAATKSYHVFERPGTTREVLGAGSFDATWQTLVTPQTALPLVVGLQEKELRTNYDWELVADDQNAITLHGTPVAGPDVMLYSSAEVVLDPNTFRTRATRMVDVARSKETIHRFSDTAYSRDAATLGKWQPELSRFKKVIEAPDVEPALLMEVDQPALPLLPPVAAE